MWEKLRRIVEKPSRLGIGLMSGTSADGTDAVLVRLTGYGSATRIEMLAFESTAHEEGLRKRILAAYDGNVAQVCALNFEFGERCAQAALAIAKKAGIAMEEVDYVASHGQTIYHMPPGKGSRRPGEEEFTASTLQIGEGSIIAQRTGVVTITDFRTADMAAGGGGAPLVPILDELLFRKSGVRRVVGNIGGISNVTLLGTEKNDGVAFDTGPGNALIDTVARAMRPDLRCDIGGRIAAEGRVDEQVLGDLMGHPYFARPAPKTTGREIFGSAVALEILKRFAGRESDCVATLTALTARSIADQVKRFAGPVDELIFSGGGVMNPTLMQTIVAEFGGTPVVTTAKYCVDPDAKEAVAFAVMGNQTLHGAAGNSPRATGAKRGAVLGKVSFP